MNTLLPIAVLVMTAVLLTTGCTATRAGYKTAPYQPVRSAGPCEVRDYPALTVVETPMTGAAGGAGFGRLFRFITGSNEEAKKIAMTTPVFMGDREGTATMAFVLPVDLKPDRVPKPVDTSLAVREIPPGRFAVLRFSGGRGAKRELAALDQLKAWMATEHLRSASSPVYGYFDPPWTPPFLRRNEVMLRLDPPTE